MLEKTEQLRKKIKDLPTEEDEDDKSNSVSKRKIKEMWDDIISPRSLSVHDFVPIA